MVSLISQLSFPFFSFIRLSFPRFTFPIFCSWYKIANTKKSDNNVCLIYERNIKIEYLTFYILRYTKRRYKWKRDISTVLHSFYSDNSTPPSCIFLAEGQKNINRRGLKLPTIDLNIYNFSDRIFYIIHQISIRYIKKTKKLKIDPRH